MLEVAKLWFKQEVSLRRCVELEVPDELKAPLWFLMFTASLTLVNLQSGFLQSLLLVLYATIPLL